MSFKTREAWLNKAVEILSETVLADAALKLNNTVKVSCGWPTHKALAGARGSRTIGQCFKTICSSEGHNEIFISPVLSDGLEVLATLVHELVHAVDNCEHSHGAMFKKMAHACGLVGKATATSAGDELKKVLQSIIDEKLGAYPHATLDVTKQLKKQTTRLIKASCGSCGYTVRITRAWINQAVPDCPLCGIEFEVEG